VIGPSLKRLRDIKAISQGELAAILGVSRQAVCMWEGNKRGVKVTLLDKIARAFGMSIGELVELERKGLVENKGGKMATKKNRRRVVKAKNARSRKTTRTTATRGKFKRTNFQLTAPGASKVVVTGDFSAWDQNKVRMKKDKKGVWKAGVNLRPGRYEYKFLVDGQWWTDPTNANATSNSYGSINSVKEVTS